MGERQAIALGHEAQAAHAAGRCEGLYFALGVARAHGLRHGPCGGAVFAQGQRVDPLALFVGEFLGGAIGAKLHHAAIITAGHEASIQTLRGEDRGLLM